MELLVAERGHPSTHAVPHLSSRQHIIMRGAAIEGDRRSAEAAPERCHVDNTKPQHEYGVLRTCESASIRIFVPLWKSFTKERGFEPLKRNGTRSETV
jgi:hypothetical protein